MNVKKIYCSKDNVEIQLIMNELNNHNIPCSSIGEISTMVLSIYNSSQETCIILDEKYVERAKTVIQNYLNQEA